MKKAVLFILVFAAALFLVACVMQSEIKYPSGKDTEESFGDGTYQILTSHEPTGYYNILYNCECQTCIMSYVEQFCMTKEMAYITGSDSWSFEDGEDLIEYTYKLYAAIELTSNRLTLCIIPDRSSAPDMPTVYLDKMIKNGDLQLISSLTDFPDSDQSVFEKLDQKTREQSAS